MLFASKAIGGRPVKWVESRRESYQSTIHGRDHITYLEIAGKRDGEITGLRVKTFANLGGRLSTIGPGIPTTLYARVLSRLLQDPERLRRGHRRLHEHDVRRRLPRRRPARGDLRHRAGDGPLRRRDRDGPGGDPPQELHPARPVPVREPVGPRDGVSGGAKIYIDSGNYEPALDKALDDGRLRRTSPAKKAEAKRRGKLLGHRASRPTSRSAASRPSKWIGAVGEGWGAAMWESSNIKVHLTGKVVVTMGTQPQGQGHETTYAQVIAHELGVPMEDIIVQHSDTQGTPFGYGSYGSRTSSVGHDGGDQGRRQDQGQGPPLRRPHARGVARRHRDRRRRVPGQGLARQEEDVPGDRLRARPRRSTLPEGMEPYLDETAYYDTPNCTWPFGTHIAVVEIDEETGEVDLVRYVAVDDVGKKINPMIVDGQLHGGIAQGVGQALWEGAIYSDDGQLLTGSMLDYALPRASWLPELRARRDGDPVAGQPARRQGRRRGRRDRQHRGRRERRHRRARAARHPPPRHAVHRPDRVAGDPVREGRPGMIPAAFDYQRAARSTRRSRLVGDGPGPRCIAGGMSLLPLMKLRLASAGAARRHRPAGRAPGRPPARRRPARDRRADDLRRARWTRRPVHYGLLRDALPDIGDVQVRNRGTVGGAVAHCRSGVGPAGVLLALDAEIVARSTRGERVDRRRRVLQGCLQTRPSPTTSSSTEIRLPGRRDDAGSAYVALTQPASGYSIVGVAAVVISEGGGTRSRRPGRPHRRRRRAVPGAGRRGGAASGTTGHAPRSPPRPPTPPTA